MDAQETIKDLATRIQETANGRAIFGEPIREGGVTIIPVSRVSVRGGGGGGTGDMPAAGTGQSDGGQRGRGQGMGIGLNVSTVPVGYIRLAPEGPRFVPIVDRGRVLLGTLALMGVALWVGKSALKYAKR